MSISVRFSGGPITFNDGHILDLELRPTDVKAVSGTIVLITGRNASGKSSFVRAISGVYEYFSDGRAKHALPVEVTRNGVPTRICPRIVRHARSDGELRAGYLAQSPRANVFCKTVEDELAFSLELSDLHRDEVLARLRRAMGEMDALGIRRDKNPHELSKGQQQVVGLKCLLQTEPDLLFLDEPTAALDARAVDWFRDKIVEVLAQQRVQIVFVVSQDSRLIGMLEGLEQTKVVEVCGSIDKSGTWDVQDLPTMGRGRLVGTQLSCRNLRTSWENFHVRLDNFDLEPGQAALILGRNGSGKSTLLDSLAGFKKADSGELICGGQKQRIGRNKGGGYSTYAFQNAEEQICFFRARDDLAHPKKYDCWAERCGPLVKAAELDLDGVPWHLSFGQRKMLTYCSLMFAFPVLFLDEPMTSLDPNLRRLLIEGVNSYLDEGGIVIATASREHEE